MGLGLNTVKNIVTIHRILFHFIFILSFHFEKIFLLVICLYFEEIFFIIFLKEEKFKGRMIGGERLIYVPIKILFVKFHIFSQAHHAMVILP